MLRSLNEIKPEFERARTVLDFPKLKSLMEELKALNSLESCAWYLLGEGVMHMTKGDPVKALEANERALIKFSDLGDRHGLAVATGNIGVIHFHTGNFLSALKQFEEAKKLSEEIGDIRSVGKGEISISLIQARFGHYDSATELFNKARGIFIQLGDKAALTRALITMGNVCWERNLDDVLKFNLEAYEICKEIGNDAGLIEASINICNVYNRKGMLPEANQIFQEVQKNDLADEFFWHNAIKSCKGFLQMANGDFDGAYQTLTAVLEYAKKSNSIFQSINTHSHLRDLAQKRNDFEGYIKHNEAFLKLKEEAEGKEKQRLLAIQEKEREMEAERKEHERERAVLYSTLPKSVADRVVKGEQVTDHFDHASVLFLDIAGFTKLSAKIPAGHVVHLLEAIFSACDQVCDRNKITKVKTIGDSYMAAAGVLWENEDHVNHTAKTAVEMLNALNSLKIHMPEELGDKSWVENVDEVRVRIGLHCGPVVAGVVGKERLQYDVWGDTVNTASRMESTGEPGKIQVSEEFANALNGDWKVEERQVEVKGKGSMKTFFLSGG